MDEWDDLLVNLAQKIAAPPLKGGKNSKKVDLDRGRWKLYVRKKAEPEVAPEERAERQEKSRRRNEKLGAPALLKNKFGENVTVTRLG